MKINSLADASRVEFWSLVEMPDGVIGNSLMDNGRIDENDPRLTIAVEDQGWKAINYELGSNYAKKTGPGALITGEDLREIEEIAGGGPYQ